VRGSRRKDIGAKQSWQRTGQELQGAGGGKGEPGVDTWGVEDRER